MLKKFFAHFKYRKLEVDILSAFTFLFFISAILVITFTYIKSYRVVSDTARVIMIEVSSKIYNETENLLRFKEERTQVTSSLITSLEDLNLENTRLLSYMYAFVKWFDYADGIYIGASDGRMLGIVRLGNVPLSVNLPRPIPNKSVFVVRYDVIKEGKTIETWVFKDENFDTLDTMNTLHTEYDPRTRPWYIDAIQSQKFSWTKPYSFYESKDVGISLAVPILDKEGKPFAVIATDLYLNTIAGFLKKEGVSKNALSLLITKEGLILASSKDLELTQIGTAGQEASPPHLLPSIFELKNGLIPFAFQESSKLGGEPFIYEYNGVDYLAVFTPFNHIADQDWVIATVAPVSDFLQGVVTTYHQLIVLFIGVFLFSVVFIYWIAKRIAKPIVELSHEIDRIKQFELTEEISVKSHIKEINMITHSLAAMKEAIKQFSYFVPKQLVQKLITEDFSFKLGGTREDITIFFSDIYGFTTISENMPPEKLMIHLSEYFSELSQIIIDNKGTIDKYSGDNIMAFWGAPAPDNEQCLHACTAALLCQKRLIDLNHKWQRENKPVFLTRIGIQKGESIVGNVGTEERMNYTVIGDPVNVASRLEGLNKLYHTKIIIGEEVHAIIASRFLTRPLDIVAVRGKTTGTKIYELIAQLKGDETLSPEPSQIELCKEFSRAFELFHSKKWQEALPLFEEILKHHPDDYPTQLYIQRTKEPF